MLSKGVVIIRDTGNFATWGVEIGHPGCRAAGSVRQGKERERERERDLDWGVCQFPPIPADYPTNPSAFSHRLNLPTGLNGPHNSIADCQRLVSKRLKPTLGRQPRWEEQGMGSLGVWNV